MRLTKSRDDEMVAGVLGGLGEYYRIDPTFLRVGFVILMFATPLPLIPLYIIAALVMPEAPKEDNRTRPRHSRGPRRPRRPRDPRDFRRKRHYSREFEESDRPKSDFSSQKEVTEDDWSDF